MDRCEARFAGHRFRPQAPSIVRLSETFAEWERHRADIARLRGTCAGTSADWTSSRTARPNFGGAERSSICCGSCDLFQRQSDLMANGLRSHPEWHDARSRNVYLEGAASPDGGDAVVTGKVAPDGSLRRAHMLSPFASAAALRSVEDTSGRTTS